MSRKVTSGTPGRARTCNLRLRRVTKVIEDSADFSGLDADQFADHFSAWLKDMLKTNPSYLGWLKIELPKRFPEFAEWLRKKGA